MKGTAGSTRTKRNGFKYLCDSNANTTLTHFTSLTAREFLASFSTCLAAWISSISPTPRNTHTCCWTRTQRRSITLETDRRGSVTRANTHTHKTLTNTHRGERTQTSATCSAVLVTRPWCSRRACLWEKRWVWLFLTRARWICAAERHECKLTRKTWRRQTERMRWWGNRQIVAEETKCNETEWKDAEKWLVYHFPTCRRLRAACKLNVSYFLIFLISVHLLLSWPPMLCLVMFEIKWWILNEKISIFVYLQSDLHLPTSSQHVRLPPSRQQ